MFDENIKRDVLADLKSLGLSHKEARVYVSLLKLGQVGSSKLIEDTGLHGQYVYNCLHSLERRGLIQHVVMRGRKKFSAKNPQVLARLADHQKKVADNLTEQLNAMMVLPQEQQYEVFQGKEAYIAHEFELLEKAEEGCELLIIGGQGDNFVELMGKELGRYERIREGKKIKVRHLGSEDQKEDLRKNKFGREYFDFRILPGLFTGLVNTNIWPNAIGFNVFGQPSTSFVVRNPQIAASYSQFFETLWRLAKPF